MKSPVTVSAPGSIMITGEHAVVYGHSAMVCAIDRRVTVTVEAIAGNDLQVSSDIAASERLPLAELRAEGIYRFVIAAVQEYVEQLPGGVAITIRSDIDPTLGLGSSAAVTIACLGALAQALGDSADLHRRALKIVRVLQGRGSGADLAASLHGGVLGYRLPPKMRFDTPADGRAQIDPLPQLPALSLAYVGYKTPTAEVLAQVAEAYAGREEEVRELYCEMGGCAAAAIDASRRGAWDELAQALQTYQRLMSRLGVSDHNLEQLIAEALKSSGTLAAKISGSGLGDCVLALGARPPGFVAAPIARQGLQVQER